MDWQFFPESELRCKCGCLQENMDHDFMVKLVRLRGEMGPLKISSAFRCPTHNSKVSSTGLTGPHTTGHAVDIKASGRLALRIIHTAREVGIISEAFGGLGVSQKGSHESRFIHLDDLGSTPSMLRPMVWSY